MTIMISVILSHRARGFRNCKEYETDHIEDKLNLCVLNKAMGIPGI